MMRQPDRPLCSSAAFAGVAVPPRLLAGEEVKDRCSRPSQGSEAARSLGLTPPQAASCSASGTSSTMRCVTVIGRTVGTSRSAARPPIAVAGEADVRAPSCFGRGSVVDVRRVRGSRMTGCTCSNVVADLGRPVSRRRTAVMTRSCGQCLWTLLALLLDCCLAGGGTSQFRRSGTRLLVGSHQGRRRTHQRDRLVRQGSLHRHGARQMAKRDCRAEATGRCLARARWPLPLVPAACWTAQSCLARCAAPRTEGAGPSSARRR